MLAITLSSERSLEQRFTVHVPDALAVTTDTFRLELVS